MAQAPPTFSRPVKNAVYNPITLAWEPMTASVAGAGDASAANQTAGNASLASLDTKTPALGQALAAGSTPVVLTAVQQTALTPPAAIAGFALEAGHLAAIDTATAKIPAQGQALAAGSTPVVLTAAQISTLTPPAAIAGFGLESTQILQATASKQDAEAVLVGAVTETAPATDIASSGLNGRLQRVAQRISSLIALLPTALSNGFFQVSLKESVSIAVTGTFFQSTQPVSLATYYGKTLTYVPVNQIAAGLLTLAAADATKKHKVLGAVLTLSLAGTAKFSDGVTDLLGPLDIGIAGGFVLPTSVVPYFETGAINRALTLTTTLGATRGIVVVLTEA